jgi:hypothetical protein
VSTTTDIAEKQKSLQVIIFFNPHILLCLTPLSPPASPLPSSQELLSVATKAKKAVAEHFFAAGFSLVQGVDRGDEDTVETVCRLEVVLFMLDDYNNNHDADALRCVAVPRPPATPRSLRDYRSLMQLLSSKLRFLTQCAASFSNASR